MPPKRSSNTKPAAKRTKPAAKRSSNSSRSTRSTRRPAARAQLRELGRMVHSVHEDTTNGLVHLGDEFRNHSTNFLLEVTELHRVATIGLRRHITDLAENIVSNLALPPRNEIGTPGGNQLFNKILSDFKITTSGQTFTGFIFNDVGNHLLTPEVPRIEPSTHWTPPVNPTYETCRKMHNRRFDFRPWVIAYPKTTEEVSWCVRLAKVLNRKVRVRSGAHDHAGESNATDALLIDCSALRQIEYKKTDEDGGLLTIGTSWKFIELFRALGEQPETKDLEIAIPHGTCQSVGVDGYLLGGGWGPYTRKYGMCCESLVAATIVLGDGEIVELDDNKSFAGHPELEERNNKLLWALRGGGGPSYGVVTSMTIKAFSVASTHNYTFLVHWNLPDKPADAATLDILWGWQELLVQDTDSEDLYLTGTNMQITAKYSEKPITIDQAKTATLECQFYGYMQSKRKWTEAEFSEYVKREWFPNCKPGEVELHRTEGMVTHFYFSNWARQRRTCKGRHLDDVKSRYEEAVKQRGKPCMLMNPQTGENEWPIQVEYLLEEDRPDPHMITSRMCSEPTGLTKDQFCYYITTLHSDLLPTPADHKAATADPIMGRNPVATYCNFNGIAGPWYRKNREISKKRCSFPYQDSCYVIQYQTWWEAAAVDNQRLHNRAMDWIQVNARRVWPCGGLKGSFISFKNSEIPEEDYFLHNYDELMKIKKRYSNDPTNILRSRKSII
eukprot:TRINITY_DN8495_c0_g1_i1.p1 TRINITY_DN8495_c0_g1~~TRINITY_DN8495_c0_g1_i1.p1  ORF type:complete len:734 (+),score=125.45 TRINITY_DN8495_c0_g1_i1:26-2203(+)